MEHLMLDCIFGNVRNTCIYGKWNEQLLQDVNLKSLLFLSESEHIEEHPFSRQKRNAGRGNSDEGQIREGEKHSGKK